MALKFHLPGVLLTEICFQGTKPSGGTLTVFKRKTFRFALRLKAYILLKPRDPFIVSGSRRESQLEKGCIFDSFTSKSRSLLENLIGYSTSKAHYSGRHSFQCLMETLCEQPTPHYIFTMSIMCFSLKFCSTLTLKGKKQTKPTINLNRNLNRISKLKCIFKW